MISIFCSQEQFTILKVEVFVLIFFFTLIFIEIVLVIKKSFEIFHVVAKRCNSPRA